MAATMTVQRDVGAVAADVVQASWASFAGQGETVVVMPVADLLDESRASGAPVVPALQAVVVPDRRLLECVTTDPTATGVRTALATLAAAEWDVVALVPADRCGAAHHVLRGSGVRLQPWWSDPAFGVCFGRVEVA